MFMVFLNSPHRETPQNVLNQSFFFLMWAGGGGGRAFSKCTGCPSIFFLRPLVTHTREMTICIRFPREKDGGTYYACVKAIFMELKIRGTYRSRA
jgi:hypothetical protein